MQTNHVILMAPIYLGLLTFSDAIASEPEESVASLCRAAQEEILQDERSLYTADGDLVEDSALLAAIYEGNRGVAKRRLPARFPRGASSRGTGLAACTIIQFDVDERGRTQNVVAIKTITDDRRPELFERASVKAAKRWRYRPFKYDGEAYVRKYVKAYMSFFLS